MSEQEYVSIGVASRLSGVPARTIRGWISRHKLAALPGHKGRLVRLEEVRALAQFTGKPYQALEGGEEAEAEEAGEHEPAVASVPAVRLDPASVPAILARLEEHYQAQAERLEQLYRDQLTAKDGQLASKDELIAELRRRAEEAERRAAQLEQPAGPVAEQPASGQESPRPWWRIWRR